MAAKPMTGQAFFVLTALADGPRHGYGIVGEVAELSQGRVKLKIGGLYGVLDRLAGEGLIEPDREEAHDGRLRRYYRLTRDGRRALAQEAELRAAKAASSCAPSCGTRRLEDTTLADTTLADTYIQAT